MKKILKPQIIIADIGAGNGQVPETVLLFKKGWGELEGGGKFLVDRTAYELVKAYAARRGNDLPWDYEHQTCEGVQAPAAGWVKPEDITWDEERGIEIRVAWTEKAIGYLSRREYRYFSPVFYVHKSDHRVCGVVSIALTNTPKTNNLTPILAKLEPEHFEEDEPNMNREELIAKLGLKENATDQEIHAAIAKIGIAITPEHKEVIPKEVVAALELEDTATASVVVASIHAIKQTGKGMVSRAEFDKLQAKLAQQDADTVVAKAMKDGKVTPDMKDWALEYAKSNPEGFEIYLAKVPAVIPLDGLPAGGEQKDADGLTSADLEVASMMGVETNDLKTFTG